MKSQTTTQEQFYFGQLLPEHIEEAAHLSAKSFLQLNKVWRSYKPSNEAIYAFFKEKIVDALAAEEKTKHLFPKGTYINYIFKRNGVMVGVVLMYELHYFLKKPFQPVALQLFNKLELGGKQLEKNININDYKEGENLYSIYGVVDSSLARKGISEKFWGLVGVYLNEVGLKYMIARYSSINSYNLVMKLGSEHVGKIQVDDDGNKYLLTMAKTDIAKTAKIYKKMADMSNVQVDKRRIEAKL